MQSLKSVRDEELLRELSELVGQSLEVEAEVVARIGEAEARRLYAREACSSMFEYCRRILRLGENETYLRIAVARAARKHPVLLDMLRDRRLHMSGIARLAPHLTRQNADAVLKRASGMSYREIRELVCELEPRPDVAPTIRKLPGRFSPPTVASPQLGAHRVESTSLRPGTDACRASSGRGAPCARPVSGPLHRRLRASREARAPPGPHALCGARRRSRSGHRHRRHREARTRRGQALRQEQSSPEGPRRGRHHPHLASHTGPGPPGRARPRRGPLRLPGHARAPVRQTPRPRVPPQDALRSRRQPQPVQPGLDVPDPQHPPRRAGLRKGRHGPLQGLCESFSGAS